MSPMPRDIGTSRGIGADVAATATSADLRRDIGNIVADAAGFSSLPFTVIFMTDSL
jgi:hypothetical protein